MIRLPDLPDVEALGHLGAAEVFLKHVATLPSLKRV